MGKSSIPGGKYRLAGSTHRYRSGGSRQAADDIADGRGAVVAGPASARHPDVCDPVTAGQQRPLQVIGRAGDEPVIAESYVHVLLRELNRRFRAGGRGTIRWFGAAPR